MEIKVLEIIGNCTLGGVESYIFNYCRTISKKYKITFLCFEDSKFLPYEFAKSIGARIELIPNIKHLFSFNKKLNELFKREKFDIVHSNINTLSVFPLRIAKKNGIKIRIAHSHALSARKEFIRNSIKSFLKLFSTKYATHYFSDSARAGIYMFGKKNANKIVSIPGLIDCSKYSFSADKRNEIRKQLGIKETDYVVGHIGRLCKTKNQKFILKLAEKFSKTNPNYKFVFIGSGKLENELKNYIVRKKLSNCIVLYSRNNVNDYYNAFDIFVLPSLYEAFGLVTIEAEANGLYCIISKEAENETIISSGGETLNLEINMWFDSLKNKRERNFAVAEMIKEKFDVNQANYLEQNFDKIISTL